MNPNIGDQVVYHGVAFCLKSWPERLLVKPGTEGTVVAEDHSLAKLLGAEDNGLRWTVDFGQGRVVIIRGFDQEFRKTKEGNEVL